MKRILTLLLAASLFFSFTGAEAAMSPIGVAIVPPVQFPGHDFSITGLRVSALWGNNRNVYGLDLGLVGNMTEGQMTGIGVSGIFNLNKGDMTGVLLQAAGLANINQAKAQIYGIQVAGLVNSNKGESVVGGLMLAPVNLGAFTKIRGLQVGLYNKARDVVGLQIGIVNDADSLHGIQIGLINFHRQGLFSVAPILNIGF